MLPRAGLATVAAIAAACSSPATPPDMSPGADGGIDGSIASGCAPLPITPPVVSWIPPHPLHRNVCTAEDAAAIATCFVQGKQCEVLVSAVCHACAVSGDASVSSAALLVHAPSSGNAQELNIAGCIGAAAGDPSSAGCGAKHAAREACIAAACAGCTGETNLQSCSEQADIGVCAMQNTDAHCAAPYLAQCVQGTTPLEIAFNLVKVFCGP